MARFAPRHEPPRPLIEQILKGDDMDYRAVEEHERSCSVCDTCRGVWCEEAAKRFKPTSLFAVARSFGPDGKQIDRRLQRARLHPVSENGKRVGWAFYCPACLRAHTFYVAGGVKWTFNGDQECPTFSPSLRIFTPKIKGPVAGTVIPERTVCHLFLSRGFIRFCGDCPHEMAGRTVEMEDWPESYSVGGD